MKRAGSALLCVILTMTQGVIAKEINKDLMERDLRIMEGVLEEILGTGDRRFSRATEGGVQGAYFDGYGILFLAQAPDRVIHFRKMVRAGKEEEGETQWESETSEKDRTKDRLTDFYQNYAGVIRQLQPTDRITVRVRGVTDKSHWSNPARANRPARVRVRPKKGATLPDSVHVKVVPKSVEKLQLERIGDHIRDVTVELEHKLKDVEAKLGASGIIHLDSDGQLVASVQKKDIDTHQGTDALRSRIHFEEVDSEGKGRDTRIFKGILGSALAKEGRSKPTGFYQEGLGAVFFVTHNRNANYTWFGDGQNFTARMFDISQDSDESDISRRMLQEILVEVVGDYGATLKSVKDSEHVVISTRLNGRGRRKGPSRLLMKVKKKTIRDYDAGKMTLEQFGKKVEWQEL